LTNEVEYITRNNYIACIVLLYTVYGTLSLYILACKWTAQRAAIVCF